MILSKPLVISNGTFEVTQGSDAGKEMEIGQQSCSDCRFARNFQRYKYIILYLLFHYCLLHLDRKFYLHKCLFSFPPIKAFAPALEHNLNTITIF